LKSVRSFVCLGTVEPKYVASCAYTLIDSYTSKRATTKTYISGVERDIESTDVALLDVWFSYFVPRKAPLVAQPDPLQVRRHQELAQRFDAGKLGCT
jgi:hypothetical protein